MDRSRVGEPRTLCGLVILHCIFFGAGTAAFKEEKTNAEAKEKHNVITL